MEFKQKELTFQFLQSFTNASNYIAVHKLQSRRQEQQISRLHSVM